ncbi:MAG: TonB family protein [Limisphaerales bacterium]
MTGFHLLLLVILFVGPAFFAPKPKIDDTQVLDVIPANLIDAAFNSGVKGATPPPTPTPIVTPPQPTPPAPQPVVTPPAPKAVAEPPPTPTPTLTERLEKLFKSEPVKETKPDPTPVTKPTANQKPKIQINTTLTTRTVPKNSSKTTKPDNSQKQAKVVDQSLQSLRNNLSSGTTIDMPGDSSAAYASYASVVKSVYTQAWTPPTDAENDDANAKVSVTIASDGTVISARLITPSGDSGVDATVQRTLNRVTFIRPFPEGTADKERTYIINFNLKAKRMLG